MKRFLQYILILILGGMLNAQEFIMQDGSFTTCSGTFYDSGGPSGLFQNNEAYTITFCPDNGEPAIELIFDGPLLMSSAGGDFMNIYDGDSNAAPLLGTFVGGTSIGAIGATDLNPTGCVTVEFFSDAGGPGPGWMAEVTCYTPCQTIVPSIDAVPAPNADGDVEVIQGDEVTFMGSATFSQSDAGVTYTWDFGDGNTATGMDATHVFEEPGTYTVTLTILDAAGCEESETILVIVDNDLNTGCPEVEVVDGAVNATGSLEVTCDYPLEDGCITLEANYIEIRSNESYRIESIGYSPPFPFNNAGTELNVTSDDRWSENVNLPFPFCFFGETYENVLVGSNGVVTFDIEGVVPAGDESPNGFCSWSFNASIPSSDLPIVNSIYGPYQDTNPSATSSPANRSINFGVLGTEPCRAFVANFFSLGLFSCRENEGVQTSQVVMYENTSVIDVYVENRTPCNTWQSGRGVLGIMNQAGTVGFTPPGRNTGNWSAQQEAWRFIPDGNDIVPVSFEWFDADGNSIGTEQNIQVCPTEDATYTVRVTYDVCSGPVVVEDTMTITFNQDIPDPVDQIIETCLDEGVTEHTWDLTSVADAVMDGQENVFVQGYYVNLEGANAANVVDQIETPEAYVAEAGTVFVRVNEDGVGGCYAVAEIELIINQNPTLSTVEDSTCDNDADGTELFDLTSYSETVLNGNQAELTYYLTQEDADLAQNPIENPTEFSAQTGENTIFVRADNDLSCFSVTTLALTLNAPPEAVVFDEPVELCDDLGDASEQIDLSIFIAQFVATQPQLTEVLLYEDLATAQNGDPNEAIQDLVNFNLSLGETTIFARLINEFDCFTIVEIPLLLVDTLDTSDASLSVCDPEQDGTETWNLNDAISQFVPDATGLTFSYYQDATDAVEGNANSVPTPEAFESGETSLFARISNGECSEIVNLTLSFFEQPIAQDAELFLCDNDGDGQVSFDLTLALDDIFNGQEGLTEQYYATLADAEAGNENVIADPSQHNANNGDTVFVRISNGDDCFDVAELTLNFFDQPTATMPAEGIALCDLDGNGEETIDLTQFESEILNGQTDMVVTYHLSSDDAQTNQNAIDTPASQVFSEGTTTVFVRVTNADGCFAITQFDVTINSSLELTPIELQSCDLGDGTAEFDLTSEENTIVGGATGYTFAYYNTFEDAQTESNAIPASELTSFVSSSATIFVRVEDVTECASITEITLTVKPLPSLQEATLVVCDIDVDGEFLVDLNALDELVLASGTIADYTFTYHLSIEDAQQNINPIVNTDLNPVQSLPLSVFVRVETNDNTACSQVVEAQFVEGEIAQVETDIAPLEACEQQNGLSTFSLADMDELVTNEPNAQITYHETLEDASNAVSELDTESVILGAQTVFVRVEVEGKCPSITQFETVVNLNPVVDITAPVTDICVADTTTLSPAQVLPNHTYVWTDEAGNELTSNSDNSYTALGEDGSQLYTLTVTNDLTGCSSDAEIEVNVIATPQIVELNVVNDVLTVVAVGDPPLEYSLDGENWTESPVFANLEDGLYTVFVRSVLAQCEGMAQQTVVLNITNVITPNGDGINDRFVIPNLDIFTDEEGNVLESALRVYDRYGKEIFNETSGPDKTSFSWDGTYGGRKVPTGDYWYILDLADGRKFTGHITVKNTNGRN